MFTRFTSPDGRGAWVRASSIRAITEQEDGAARLFLGYGLQTVESGTPTLFRSGPTLIPALRCAAAGMTSSAYRA